MYIKNKKADGSIFLAIFFIVIILIILSLFTSFHKTILTSNYNINFKNFNEKKIYSLKDELYKCYSNPIKIDSINKCPSIKDLNFEIKVLNYGSCENEILLKSGKIYPQSQSLFISIVDKNLNICPAQIYLYFEK